MNIKKTPVSILQEMMVKKGMAPSYELIHNGGGTHQNSFTYQVTCDELSAIGTGRCKKDAKHEAATAMLESIASHNAFPQLPASPCESPVRTPLPMSLPICPKSPANVPFRNAIGELQDLCSTNNLDDPVYKETGDVGPPHARVFTAQCLVSTFLEEGTATTKKQAKHEAARKMIERIMVVVSDDPNYNDLIIDENRKKEQMASKIAIARYPDLSVTHNTEAVKSKVNWGLKIKNYHKKFKESFDEENRNNLQVKLENVLKFMQEYHNSPENLDQWKEEFECILKSVDIQYHKNIFNSNTKTDFVLGIQLNTAPDIHEIGFGKTANEAEISALQNILETMKFLLK